MEDERPKKRASSHAVSKPLVALSANRIVGTLGVAAGSEVVSNDEKTNLAIARLVGPEHAVEIDMEIPGEAKLDARSNTEDVLRFAPVLAHAVAVIEDFNADTDLAIEHRVAEAAGDLELLLAFAAGLRFPDEIHTPVPARRDLVAEQQLEFIDVRPPVLVRKFVFAVESRITPNLSPVGNGPTQLDVEALVMKFAEVVAFDVVVEIELHSIRQPYFDFLKQPMRNRVIAVIFDAPPAFDADFPWLFLDVNTRAGEAARTGPFGAIGDADGSLFTEYGSEGGGGGLGHASGRFGGWQERGCGEAGEEGKDAAGMGH